MYIDVEEVGDKTVKGKHKEEKIAANDTLNHSLRESQKGKRIIFV